MTTKDLSTEEYIPYFSRYIENAEGLNLLEGLESSLHANLEFYKAIPENKFEYAYAENKWTIKELISHLIDTERIFCYRALRFSRQDKTPVAGFEQDDYVINSNANNRSIEDLLSEYKIVREASIALYKSFSRDIHVLCHLAQQCH